MLREMKVRKLSRRTEPFFAVSRESKTVERTHDISPYTRERLERGGGGRKEYSLRHAGVYIRAARRRVENFQKLPPISDATLADSVRDRYGRRHRLIAPRAIPRVGIMDAEE